MKWHNCKVCMLYAFGYIYCYYVHIYYHVDTVSFHDNDSYYHGSINVKVLYSVCPIV